MDGNTPVNDLTVEQLQSLIRHTVQEAVAEVMIEFAIASEIDAEIEREAEMVEHIRTMFDPMMPSPQIHEPSPIELDD